MKLRSSPENQWYADAPIFEHGQRSIGSLVSDIEREVIALPDLQRPFVWEDVKVRDLLDSLFSDSLSVPWFFGTLRVTRKHVR
jgi:hypothetical protein